ncbi:hypothetical protein GCM10027020_34910 [Nocardioides salsibiostraticola]
MRRRSSRNLASLVGSALVGAVLLSGCSLLPGSDPAPALTTVEPTAVTEFAVDSQFTRDGTFQSHISVKGAQGMDFVYTLYPTKSTPRTNEWFPRGKKYFSFTFQAYDLSRELRDPFDSKREVYLDTMKVTSSTIKADGKGKNQPYRLDAKASAVTFDPEAVQNKYGMLITSPKGAFELRNQAIKATPKDTRGIELTFTAVVYIEERAGSNSFIKRAVEQVVPIAIFESDEPTTVAKIPVNAN